MSFEDLSFLKHPFLDKDLDWRVGRSGLTAAKKPWAAILAYVDARAVMNRLDKVVGPTNWKDEYRHVDGGIECTLYIKHDGEWIGKTDASPETKIEALKGGYSKALVRAAVKWGIGRYLYELDNVFATIVEKNTPGAIYSKNKEKNFHFYWKPPLLNKSGATNAKPLNTKPDKPVPVKKADESPTAYEETTGSRSDAPKKIVKLPDLAETEVVPVNAVEKMNEIVKGNQPLREYRADFGKFKGRSFDEINNDELKNYVAWAESKLTPGSKNDHIREYISKAKEYLNL